MIDDLVDLLRLRHTDTWPMQIGKGDLINTDGPAAANRIEELEAALQWIVEKDQSIMRRADFHTDCKCHRCAMDNARKLLGVHL